MRISFQTKPNSRIDFDFGYDTALFAGMYWFTIVKVDLNQSEEVEYASILFALFLHPKYWFRSFRNKLNNTEI